MPDASREEIDEAMGVAVMTVGEPGAVQANQVHRALLEAREERPPRPYQRRPYTSPD